PRWPGAVGPSCSCTELVFLHVMPSAHLAAAAWWNTAVSVLARCPRNCICPINALRCAAVVLATLAIDISIIEIISCQAIIAATYRLRAAARQARKCLAHNQVGMTARGMI